MLPNTEYYFSLIVKGEHRFGVIYTRENADAAIGQFGAWAARSDLCITFYEAAVVSQRIRRAMAQVDQQDRGFRR
jgi:hypothetical protein